jgi:hypothetical protein
MAIAVICINAKNRPADFPEHLWLTENVEIYHIKSVFRKVHFPGVFGVTLEERDLTPIIDKYDCFDHRRFRPATEADLADHASMEELLESLVEESVPVL